MGDEWKELFDKISPQLDISADAAAAAVTEISRTITFIACLCVSDADDDSTLASLFLSPCYRSQQQDNRRHILKLGNSFETALKWRQVSGNWDVKFQSLANGAARFFFNFEIS